MADFSAGKFTADDLSILVVLVNKRVEGLVATGFYRYTDRGIRINNIITHG